MDSKLEQAAMDLYATPFQTFRYVTFPLALPGIMAAALLSFSLSFDDYIVTVFNSGRVVTFPIYIWSAAQRGIPPQVNVIASLMFLGSLLLVLVASLISKNRRESKA
jgi:spermidine/putrescine transport system permease protein